MASAWGRPPGWVQPRPTTMPLRTTSAATAGLGRLSGRARSASAAAAASQRASSVCTRDGGLLRLCPGALACGTCGASGFFRSALALGLGFHGLDVEAGGTAESLVRLALAFGAGFLFGADAILEALVLDVRRDDEIGRASCRERV